MVVTAIMVALCFLCSSPQCKYATTAKHCRAHFILSCMHWAISFAWRNTVKCRRRYCLCFIFNLSLCSPSILFEVKELMMNISLWDWPNTVFYSIPLQKSGGSVEMRVPHLEAQFIRLKLFFWLPIQWVFSSRGKEGLGFCRGLCGITRVYNRMGHLHALKF